MKSMAIGRAVTLDVDFEGGKTQSRDESEKNLAASSWEYFDGRKGQEKVTVTNHPRDIV